MLLKLFHTHTHIYAVGSPKDAVEKGTLRPYDDVIYSHQCHTCHGPYQHKDEPSTVAEWRGMLVFDAESECLEHLLPGSVHQCHRYDVLDEGTGVGTRETHQKFYTFGG